MYAEHHDEADLTAGNVIGCPCWCRPATVGAISQRIEFVVPLGTREFLRTGPGKNLVDGDQLPRRSAPNLDEHLERGVLADVITTERIAPEIENREVDER